VNLTINGGSAAPGGLLTLSAQAAHPGYIASYGYQGVLKLSLAATGGDARWNALKFDVYGPGSPPPQDYSVGFWRDSNNNGILEDYSSPPNQRDTPLGDHPMSGGSSTSTFAFNSAEDIYSGNTRAYFLTLNLGFGASGYGQKTGPLGLRVGSTSYFSLSKGSATASAELRSGTATVRIGVDAQSEMYDTGIFIDQGLSLNFTATGTWNTNYGASFVGPAGEADTRFRNTVNPEANVGELLGAIGPSPFFRIGTGTVVTAQYAGNLRLTMNDYPGDYWNNSGRAFVDFAVSGSTTTTIEGSITYGGTITSGTLNVYFLEKYCPDPWCDAVDITTQTLNFTGSPANYQQTGLRPGFYGVRAQLSHNPQHNGEVKNPVFAAAGSTTTVSFPLAQGQASIAGSLSYTGV
ncbi:MAG: LecA/PA-IL family lectin, partial [Chloroflexota bacterium]